ncbi:MAG TPA: SpoIIE family protein phosphatase [Anaerolineae bacterium]|nr:SpoIIE family protein phosphatase [Anaerolineae bacterium]
MTAARAKTPDEILIVDDSPTNLRLLSKMLTDHGYAVRAVTSGKRALESIRSENPDLVLLDIRMPEMDGYEVCRQLKSEELCQDIPVIFISALDEIEDKVRAFSVGGVDYITKPFQLEEVLVRVETHLSLRHLQEQLQKANRRLETELALAGNLQASFFPSKLPEIPGWELAAAFHPARETSGDFYDWISLPGSKIGILIGDVVDKGVSAALYMALSWTLIRTFALQHPDHPELVVEEANRRIIEDTDATRFVTVFYGIIDPGRGMMTYCNAGHPPPLLLRSGRRKDLVRLTRTGIPLGIETGRTWEQGTAELASKDVLVLHTDGVTDAQDSDGAFFGQKDLEKTLGEVRNRSAEEIKQSVLDRVATFVGGSDPYDDIALLVIRRIA